MEQKRILEFYSRKDIQREIVEISKEREIAARFNDSFGKRPDILQYESDVLEIAKQGATSFHCSEELWKNPLNLMPSMSKKDMDSLRKGWDLVIDIDCKYFDYSKIAANIIAKFIKSKGIDSVSAKFSGGTGFHIGVSFEAFPSKIRTTKVIDTKDYFPDGVRIVASYIKEMIKEKLAAEILDFEDIEKIMKRTSKKFNELVENKKFNPYSVLGIDAVLISSRHLFRAPYSFNEKTWLVSVPVNPDKIKDFSLEDAKPENVKVSKFKFLERNAKTGSAKNLFDDAFYWSLSTQKENISLSTKIDFKELENAVPVEFFPPCIKKGLQGIDDGKKRFLFIVVNFFTSVGWDYDSIEKLLKEWNAKNKEPLKEVYLLGQLRYHKQHKKKILPPNCSNKMYYADLQICSPDSLCSKIKNPVNYAIISQKKRASDNTKKSKKDTN
jgi:hypothetical protein